MITDVKCELNVDFLHHAKDTVTNDLKEDPNREKYADKAYFAKRVIIK